MIKSHHAVACTHWTVTSHLMSAAEKKTAFKIATVVGTMRQRITATVQSLILRKLKQGNIFWKISMKMPVNRHYYSLVTENVAGRGEGVYVLVFFGGG